MNTDRDAIVERVRLRMLTVYTEEEIARGGNCLYWAGFLIEELHRDGWPPALFHAGSLSWPFVADELDDGVSASHFSYMWEGYTAESRALIAEDNMPEMHTWVAIPETGEFVDLSTKYLPAAAKISGHTWSSPAPPPYLWSQKIPPGVMYRPCVQASALAYIFWARANAKLEIKQALRRGEPVPGSKPERVNKVKAYL